MRPLHIRAFANSSVLFSCRFIVHLIASLPQASSFIFGAFPDACVLFPIHFIFLHFLSLPSLITGHYRIFPVLVRSPSGPFHIPSFPLISVFQIRPFPDFFHHFLSFMSPQECILCSFSFLPLPCFFHLSCCISPSLMFPHFPTIPSYVLSFPEDFVFPSHQFVTFRFFCCIISGNSVFHVHHFPVFFTLVCCCFPSFMFRHFPKIPSNVFSFPTDSVFHFHHFRVFFHLFCCICPSLMFPHFPTIPSCVLSFPEDLVFQSHHFRDFPVFWAASCPKNFLLLLAIVMFRHFPKKLSYVLSFPEDSVLHFHHLRDFSVLYAASYPQNSVLHFHHVRFPLLSCIISGKCCFSCPPFP